MTIRIDNLGFIVNEKRFFPLGFNYWPRDMAVYLWEEYDSRVIEREMKIISELGANCIRMFIRWEDLNPHPGKINLDFFEKFEDFLNHAKKNDIKLVPTLLIGHMSGQDWFPNWFHVDDDSKDSNVQYQIIKKPPDKKEEGKCRDIYVDPLVLENSKLQIKELLSRYKDDETIISWDLSNENQYWMKPKTPKIGTNYMKEMYKLMKKIDPNTLITYGMGKPDEISGFISSGPNGFAQYNDYYSVHVYPDWLYPRTRNLLDFYISYRNAYECCLAKVSEIPVQLQEFGLSNFMLFSPDKKVRDDLLYGYFNVAFGDVILNEIRGGVLTWDFCDFLPELSNRNPYDHKDFELTFGAVDKNYQLKPSGKAFKKFSRFTKEVDIYDFSRSKAKVALIMPDSFNEFPKIQDPKSILEVNNLNHRKTLFSSFIFLKMCHHNFDFILLNDTEKDLEQYQLMLFPNIHQLSENSTRKITRFLNRGKNRMTYFSSNAYFPREIFGEMEYQTQKGKKRTISCFPANEELEQIFPNTIDFKAIRSQCLLKNNDLNPILMERGDKNQTIMFQKEFKDGNNAVFLTVSPEINHTQVRNSYKKETGHLLYQSLAKWSGLDNDIKCSNPLIEVGILYNKNKSEAILIAINHEFSTQKCKIELKETWNTIKEFYGLKFNRINDNVIEFTVEPYGNHSFILSF